MELASINLTITVNKEKAISKKIGNYIERKLNNPPNSKADSSSNTEVNNSVYVAVVSNSIKRPNNHIKTQETKKKDQVNEDSYFNATTCWNESKQSSSNSMCNSQTRNNSSSLPAKIEDERKNNIADESKLQNEIRIFMANRKIGKSTTLKETISKTLKNITIDIDTWKPRKRRQLTDTGINPASTINFKNNSTIIISLNKQKKPISPELIDLGRWNTLQKEKNLANSTFLM
ncbi:hypothetical protein O181_037716 [Austropuccinia psidii MF-1]|uniref:Uncharacterized protein n=1 Tax=Austropuccinia psidii MF-1 TaxID=1389203 RepID=A0A9Q3D6R1_9BASI|nr:hypothetical protein [Austropuccinia psidii MF-1]